MFGTNPVAKARKPSDGFLVKSIFYTIQGEGPFAGFPAIFVRFAGCNLQCSFCDTDFSGGVPYGYEGLAKVIATEADANNCKLIVLTGGEPMLQPLTLLIQTMLRDSLDIHFQIETAGTVWPEGFEDVAWNNRVSIVCSPKTPTIDRMLAGSQLLRIYFKYIIRATDTFDPVTGLPSTLYGASTSKRGKLPENSIVYVQPCDEGNDYTNTVNMQRAVDIAMNRGYRLSLQMHKIAGVD